MSDDFDQRKAQASAWFRQLRDEIVAAFEGLEDTQTTGPFADRPPGRFDVTETKRASDDGSDAGGGLMSVMRDGRVFEKVGVNVSTVFGTLAPRAQAAMAARKDIPGIKDDPRFWAAGISLVAHMQNPQTPAVHMNTRMFWTPHAWWFGGGSDLNPCLEYEDATAHFHAVQKSIAICMAPSFTPNTRPGQMSIFTSRIASARAVWVGFSTMIAIPETGTRILH